MTKKKENSLNYKFQGTGLKGYELRSARKRFEDYCDKYHFESISDLQLLEELVYRESLQERYKKKILDIANKEGVKEENVVPTYVLKALDENLSKQLEIKDKLGLFNTNKGKDPLRHFKTLTKKFHKWMENNQASRTFSCPFCSKMIMLKIKTDSYDALKHPFFKDKILSNKHLWKLYKEGKITKLDVAKVLLGDEVTTSDYVDWLAEKIYKDSK